MRWIPALFLVSGVPALLYQIVWQRMLFGIFGTNIESVTIVVAGFMLGLGLGSLAGGGLSQRLDGRWLLGFAAIELLIGLLGLASPVVFGTVAEQFHSTSLLATGVMSFALVVAPTVLMGATLPLLTADLVARTRQVGRSVGVLYGLNTIGSALACVLAAEWAMGALGMTGVVRLAAGLNLLVALGALGLAKGLGTVPQEESEAPAPPLTRLAPAMAVTGLVGFVTLSHEILWVRVMGFMTMGGAKAFPWVLALFLTGIAAGALAVRPLAARLAEDRRGRGLFLVALVLTVLVAFLGIPAMGRMVTVMEPRWTLVWVFAGAALWGTVLPLFSQAYLPAGAGAGPGLSRLYAANIAGAVLGTLLTGFVGLQFLSLETVSVVLGVLGLASALVALMALGAERRHVVAGLAALALLGGGMAASAPTLFANLYERLFYKEWFRDDAGAPRFVDRVENRSGVVGITQRGLVVGNGAFDGTVNIRIAETDTGTPNHVHRAYALALLHPAPKRILMIGLSTGAWAQVLANHPAVDAVTVVEINPGYLELIPRYPRLKSLLTNPKIRIVIDDGRRWLRNNRGRTFDAVVMNATFNWRAMASSLLSTDFLDLVRPYLAPGGLLYYNSTFSPEVRRTALESFPHVMQVGNFVAASDSPITPNVERWKATLANWRIDGQPVVDPEDIEEAWALETIESWYRRPDRADLPWWAVLEDRKALMRSTAGARGITDDNMGTEWSGGPGLGSHWEEAEARAQKP